MQITNPNNLPECLVQAVTPEDRGLDPERMSITDLINPPMMRHLRMKHWHEMTERVDDRVWLMLGTAFHRYADFHTPDHSEVKIEYKYAGYTIVGVIDLLSGKPLNTDVSSIEGPVVSGMAYKITDYKVTSVYSFLLGDKIEWEQQLNAYAWLAAQKGINIYALSIVAILRDWIKSKTFKDHQYPTSAILDKSVPLWAPEKREAYIQRRIEAHMTRNGEVQRCTNFDKWHKDDTFAVKIPNVQKAKRVLPTYPEAEEWAKANMKGAWEIEERKGEDSRCKMYCSVRNYCDDNIYRGAEDTDAEE